ncbi:MAG: ExbD/TolR family protein [Thermoguttaceae bacterium]|jgi:biopolymer transport protein ExbD
MSLRDVTVSPEVPKVQMTPMIDIVFNLLAFFIVTFRIPAVEGDFNIKMPVNAPPSFESMDESVPLEITLRSDESGGLTGIFFGSKPLGTDMRRLRAEVFDYLQTGSGASNTEAEFTADAPLRYGHLIDAITAVSGYVNSENQVVKMIENIKFTPPK